MGELLTFSGKVEAPKSRRGSLYRLFVPSTLIFRVTKVSGVTGAADAMTAVPRLGSVSWVGPRGDGEICFQVRKTNTYGL